MNTSTIFKLVEGNTYFHYDHLNGSMVSIVNDGCYSGIFTRCDSNCAVMARQFHKEEYHNVPIIYRDYVAVSTEEYVEAADAFGTSIGVAHIIGFKNKSEHIKEEGIESFKKIEPELEVNYIILDAIDENKYQELQREIYKIKQKGDKRLKEKTIYRKALEIVLYGKK